ncbi:hypothetical protein WDW37_07665 [Bdellovibrionota bacterium FG-1]
MRSAAKSTNFHVPLPEETYSELREASQDLNRPATQLVREVIQTWLKQRKKEVLRQQLAAYVSTHSGTRYDLDPELEAAGIEHLLDQEAGAKIK